MDDPMTDTKKVMDAFLKYQTSMLEEMVAMDMIYGGIFKAWWDEKGKAEFMVFAKVKGIEFVDFEEAGKTIPTSASPALSAIRGMKTDHQEFQA